MSTVDKLLARTRRVARFLPIFWLTSLVACTSLPPQASPAQGEPLAETLAEIEQLHRGTCGREQGLCARSKFVPVLDSYMHYREAGDPRGPVILLLHGQPTWSYLYRNIIPKLPANARVIAPDAIGYGFSGRPELEYSWQDQVDYLEAFIAALDLREVVLVLHDFGSFQGLAYAQRHPDNVRGLVLMESVVAPFPSLEVLAGMVPPGSPLAAFVDFIRIVKTDPVATERLIVDENVFIEGLLPNYTGRALTAAEMNAYRLPFRTRASRYKMINIPAGMPLGGVPAENHALVARYAAYLATSQVPKLVLYSTPGLLIGPEAAHALAQALPNTRAESLGPGLHFVQEEHPAEIAAAISRFTRALPSK